MDRHRPALGRRSASVDTRRTEPAATHASNGLAPGSDHEASATSRAPEDHVCIENISKRYGGLTALDGVSLKCRHGELLTLLGPSGSGKSTLLRILAGLERPDGGRVLLDGEDLLPIPPYARGIGVMFQSYALFPHMSVVANVQFPLRMRKVTDARTRAMDALRMVGLDSRADAKPAELSGGMQQRVALARAVVFNPRLLLLDEPLSALDRKLRDTLQVELRELQQRLGVTTISVTHDQEEALRMSDRIAVINEGRLLQIGPAAEVYRRPSNLFVAGFLGNTNVLTGVSVNESGGHGVKLADGTVVFGVGPVGSDSAVVKAEDVQLETEPFRSNPSQNSLSGVITVVTFEGARTMVTVELPGVGRPFCAPAGTSAVAKGDHVWVKWDISATTLVTGTT